MELTHQLLTQLKQLRLSGMLSTLEVRERQAIEGKWSYLEFVERLLQDEVERRAQKQLAMRVRRAAITSGKTLEGFDFSFNPSINRQQILHLASGEYIRRKRNVLIYGPSGVGKSHLAQALAHEACRQGYDVLFVATHKMLTHLNGGRADGRFERRVALYVRPHVLILDDFGLRDLSSVGSEDIYEIIAERYERGSIILTSNRAPSEWPSVFGNPLLASAGCICQSKREPFDHRKRSHLCACGYTVCLSKREPPAPKEDASGALISLPGRRLPTGRDTQRSQLKPL